MPNLPSFSWGILVCMVMLVLLVKRFHILSVKLLGKKYSVHSEVCGECSEHIRPMTKAKEALRPPRLDMSPPVVQTLCLLSLNTNLDRSSLLSTVDFLEKAQKSQFPQLSQVSDGKPTLNAGENGDQVQKKIMTDVNENTHFLESLEMLNQEIERWKQRLQEKKEEKERLEQSNTQMEQILNDKVNQLTPVAEHVLKMIHLRGLLVDHVDNGNLKVLQVLSIWKLFAIMVLEEERKVVSSEPSGSCH